MDREKEIFFDGVVADWLVQSKISDARRQVDDAIWKVELMLDQSVPILQDYLTDIVYPDIAKRVTHSACPLRQRI